MKGTSFSSSVKWNKIYGFSPGGCGCPPTTFPVGETKDVEFFRANGCGIVRIQWLLYPTERKTVGGGKIVTITDLMSEIRTKIKDKLAQNSRINVPEQFVILRALQFAEYYWRSKPLWSQRDIREDGDTKRRLHSDGSARRCWLPLNSIIVSIRIKRCSWSLTVRESWRPSSVSRSTFSLSKRIFFVMVKESERTLTVLPPASPQSSGGFP